MVDVNENLLALLAMPKYEGMLPRLFPEAATLEIRDRKDDLFWNKSLVDAFEPGLAEETAVWQEYGDGVERRQTYADCLQFRSPLQLREHGSIAWLLVSFQTRPSVPMSMAKGPLLRAFAEARAFLHDELALQAECNQLAVELTERYEELNLVYSTKDQIEHFEESREALSRLVHNCADYLDVGCAVLICRDRGLFLHETNVAKGLGDVDALLDLLATTIYDRIESQVQSIVINEVDDAVRERFFRGRHENLLAFPIVGDHGGAIGILAVVAHREVHTFSNGDRNLLEVMAKKASRIIHMHHDSLTGLTNRSGFESALMAALAGARSKNLHHCLLHIDIDQLHVVNDLMGFQEGDNLIRRIAGMLRRMLRESDSISRLGGDEFAVLLTNCDLERATSIANKIRDAIHDITVVSANKQLAVTVSIGIVGVNRQSDGIMSAMASAEIACKAAKDGGNDRIEVFEVDNRVLVQRSAEIEWIGRLQQALRDDRFELYCQPVLPLSASGHAPHYEVLIRMRDEDGEILSPALFLPAAERYQLMPLLDRWVIRNAFKILQDNREEVAAAGAVFCINLSGQSLTNAGFLTFISDELHACRIAPGQICFEITETAAISNIDEAKMFLGKLQDIGCRFALDDFGAGLSSFGYLKVLPVNYLKIDGSFVREITSDKVSHSMVNAIYQIGRSMGLSIIAEFVGDQATVDELRGIGVDYGQGYFIGKPAPIHEIIDRLATDASAASG